jgi:hypothetical protein
MSGLAISPSERREDPRVSTTIAVHVAFEGEGTIAMECVDVSASGMCLRYESLEKQASGRLVTLHFEVPGLQEPVAVLGIVRWSQPGPGGLLGIHFATGLRAREVWAIGHLESLTAAKNKSAAPPPLRRANGPA